MCEIKPGPRCAADTREVASRTATLYAETHADGPDLNPLAPAGASIGQQRQTALYRRFLTTRDPVEKGRIAIEAATAAASDGLIDPADIDSTWRQNTDQLVARLANDTEFRTAVVNTTTLKPTHPQWFGTDVFLHAQDEAARRERLYAHSATGSAHADADVEEYL